MEISTKHSFVKSKEFARLPSHDQFEKEEWAKKSLLYKISKWIHKYIGLVLVAFLVWMSISGILLNHPKAISSISVPTWAVPSHYIPQNWNRSSLVQVVYSNQNENVAYACGKLGVWKSADLGNTFMPFMDGDYPKSDFYRKTNQLYLHETQDESVLYAGNDFGLYELDVSKGEWEHIPLDISPIKIVKFIPFQDEIIILAETGIYSMLRTDGVTNVIEKPAQQTGLKTSFPLIDFFFELHSGKLFGFFGQLLFDVAGLVLLYLSFTALYTWLYPKKNKKDRRNGTKSKNPMGRRLFHFLLKYHLSLGMWFGIFLFIFGATGFFMRPPFLAFLVDRGIDLPGFLDHRHQQKWVGKIQNGMFDNHTDEFVIATSDGMWKGKLGENESFSLMELDWPIFVMGATVFESIGPGRTLVGSFSGLYDISADQIDQMTGEIVQDHSAIKTGDFMVTGLFETPEKESFIFTHEKGIIPLPGFELNGRFNQPTYISEQYRMPLWNYVFEIHNGRYFKGILGQFYILLLPLGSLLFVLITVTGVIDWFFRKKRLLNPK